MKSVVHITFKAVLLMSSLLMTVTVTSCRMTGDPMQDSIFFSQRQADARLAQKHAYLRSIERGTESETIRARMLNHEIGRESARQKADGAKLSSLKVEIAAAEARLKQAKSDVVKAEANAGDIRTAIQRRNEEQAEVNRLTQILNLRLQTE